jgi:hypothetical protein
MNQDRNAEYESNHHAEETLRLVAELRPPAELAERVHRRLADERNAARRGFWSLWMPAQRLQFAAAAALVIAVAGSTWSVYHGRPQMGGGSQAAPATVPTQPARALPGISGGFGSAGVARVPPTLHPIKVPPAPKKKPNPGHMLAKPSLRTPAAQPAAGDAASKPVENQ